MLQAKQILKKLGPRSASKMSIDSNTYIFQSVFIYSIIYKIHSVSCSYMIDNGICYLTLTDKSYPKRLAFLFLEEISKDFIADLKAEHGDE